MLISQSKAAREIGISKQRLCYYFDSQRKQNIKIPFLKKNDSGIDKVDDEHPEWIRFKDEYKTKMAPSVVSRKMQSNTMKRKSELKKKMGLSRGENKEEKESGKKSNEVTGKKTEKKKNKVSREESEQQITTLEDGNENSTTKYTPEEKEKIFKLQKESFIAGMRKEIYNAKIQEEKSKQEEIKTLQKIKSVGSIDIIKHYFSFEENLIQRIFRRPHEILPQLKTLLLAHEDTKAEQLLVRELEGIVNDSHDELLKAIKEDGFRIKKEIRKLNA